MQCLVDEEGAFGLSLIFSRLGKDAGPWGRNLFVVFTSILKKVTDPRANRGLNYPLGEMIFVALCGAICGCDSWVDIAEFGRCKLRWFRRFLPFQQGVPSHDTFTEIFSRLDTIEFYAALESWTKSIATSLRGETVAFDGKTLRGSFDTSTSQSPLHSVSAWACGLRLCVGLRSVEEGSNEIPAVQSLIDMLDLQGSVVTADALHCQKETVQKVVGKEADYVLYVKGNQAALRAEIQTQLLEALESKSPSLRQQKQRKANREREETRSVAVIPVPANSPLRKEWKGLETIGAIYRCREVEGRTEESQVFFISSLPCKVRTIAKHLRSHWGIENRLHHVLDVTFTEDSSRIRKGTGPEISSVFRRLALNILQRDTTVKASIRCKRKICGWDEDKFEKLIAGFIGD